MKLVEKLSDSEIVKADKASIYLGNIFTVDADLKLPLMGKFGSTITWESENTNIIGNNGKVVRPAAGAGNAAVTLTAVITCNGAADTREFKVTVLEKERVKQITAIKEVSIETAAGHPPVLPAVVITVKDDGSFGAAVVTWAPVDPSGYARAGEFSIEGSLRETTLKAVAKVKVNASAVKAAPIPHGTPPRPIAGPFSLSQVTLRDHVFTANRDRGHQYLLSVDNDRMLYNFRAAARLDTGNVQPPDGWDAPDCNLRGHTTGHYLSAVAQAYAGSGDDRFKDTVDYMVDALGKCQDAMAAAGKSAPGFLSGYSEEQFIKLEQYAKYPEIWAPYYTLHKIMAGLLDCYELAGSSRALDIARKMGNWVYDRLNRLSGGQLLNMWALYIAGEYGSINETLARLYTITGDENYCTAAKYFDNDKLFVPMADNIDTLEDVHANQHIPEILGALQVFYATGEPYYYHIAENFWNMVVEKHLYTIGGTGSGEMFKLENKIAKYLNDKTAETCATYNMLKLTRNLFFLKPESRYMDYYERALYNHILASQDQSAPNGGSTYFMPLFPGMQKEYDVDGNSCCHGTGMENHTKYQDSVYFQSEDRSTLYVNLYIASELNWKERDFRVVQTGNFLADQASTITVNGSGRLDIKLRVPFWSEKGFMVRINDIPQDIPAVPGSYLTLSREWTPGDKIHVSIPFSFRLERTPDDPAIASILYGPLVMVGKSDSKDYIVLASGAADISGAIQPTRDPLTFIINGTTLVPNYTAYDVPYHAYFKIK